MIVFNLIMVWLCWGWADDAFESGKNELAWFHVFCSAFNAAAVAHLLTL